MEQTAVQGKEATSSRFWQILRWVPLTTMALAIVILLGMLLAGGMTKISGWYLLQLIPPVLGTITLIMLGIYIVVKNG